MAAPLSTLLATRLDAVLGTTLAQHPVLLEGGKPLLSTQPTATLHGEDSVIRRSTEHVGEAAARAGRSLQQGAVGRQAGTAIPGRALPPAITPSAQAILSEPARTLLALLLLPPEPAGARRAAAPLWADKPAAAPGRQGDAGGARSAQSGTAPGRGDVNGLGGERVSSATAQASASAIANASSGAGSRTTTSSTHRTAPGPASTSTAGAVQGARLAPATPGMANALAGILANQVAYSGLFYESHLAQMSFGQRSPAQLAQEPQAHLGQPGGQAGAGKTAPAQMGTPTNPATSQPAQAGTPTQTGAPAAPAAAEAGQSGTPTNAQAGAQTGTSSNASSMASMGTPTTHGSGLVASAPPAAASSGGEISGTGHSLPAAPIHGVHPEAVGLVRQQLETLANAQFTWQGEAWPGAELEWEIQDDGARQEAGTPNTWSSRLHLNLPGLGAIDARVSLAGNQLVLRLEAPDSAALLRTHAAELRTSLQDSGLTLSDLAILEQATASGHPSSASAAATSGHPPTGQPNSSASPSAPENPPSASAATAATTSATGHPSSAEQSSARGHPPSHDEPAGPGHPPTGGPA